MIEETTEEGGRSAPASVDHPAVGERLREERRRHGLSVRELAKRIGLSPSLVSQVETGRANPSVSTLYAMASELGVSVDDLLSPGRRASGPSRRRRRAHGAPTAPVAASPVQRGNARKVLRLASGVVWENLASAQEPGVDFLAVTYEVGGASSPVEAFQRHSGREWGIVLSGRLGVTIGFDDYVLEPGDSISVDSSMPHRLYNVGDVPVKGIWFVVGRRAPYGTPHVHGDGVEHEHYEEDGHDPEGAAL